MSRHVLVVARWYPSWDAPGRGSFVADHVAALRAAGVTVTVASFDPTGVRGNETTRPERAAAAADLLAGPLATVEAEARPVAWGVPGVPVARLPVILDGSRRRPDDVVEAHRRALVPYGLGLAERRPIDLVHAHTGLPDGLAAADLAQRLGRPLVTTEHSSTAPDELADPVARDAYRALVGPGRRLVAVSASLGRELAARLGLDDRAIGVLPNAVPIDGFPVGDRDARDPHELLYVGARKATKGIETLLRAFAELHRDDPGLRLRLRLVGTLGTPDEEARWRELAGELGVAAAVTFEGRAERAAVAAAMRRAAAFVHPSPRETFGMVAAEALASGLPVAASPSGGVDEIVGPDGRFGEIAADQGPSALADAVRRVLARRETFVPAAMRAHVEASFAAPAVAARTIELYEELIAAGRGTASFGRGAAPAGPAVDRGADLAGRGRDVEPAVPAPFRPPLVVGLVRRLAIERLAVLPPGLAGCLAIVTSAPAAGTVVGAGAEPAAGTREPAGALPTGRWLELDPELDYRRRLAELGRPTKPGGALGRFLSIATSPKAERERRDLVARRPELRRQATESFLRSAWEEAGRPPFVLALDADDVLAAEPLLAAGARLAPGGLRWLVDRWDEAGRPAG